MPEPKRLLPPPNGVTIRMYRIGHGDCFLLAFAGKVATKPVYVLIDCGYKPGSPKHLDATNKQVARIAENIRAATGGHLDVAVITHEHQDHVNAITAKHFKNVTIDETWLAWTEDPKDDLANDLRRKFKDKLRGLLAARNRLAADGDVQRSRWLDTFLAFELGGEEEQFDPAAAAALLGAAEKDPLDSLNKKAMQIWKDLAAKGPRFLRPQEKFLPLAGTDGVRVYCLGPPRNPELLASLDPKTEEEFHGMALSARSAGGYFAAAARAAEDGAPREPPFDPAYWIRWGQAALDPLYGAFFRGHYGTEGAPGAPTPNDSEAAPDADWRRIDKEWLYSAEQLALDMNSQTNNASLVLAFELGQGGKVLLFAADAQRGNWISWAGHTWRDGDRRITTRDLLSRTVLYKVGHHGSHNATLNGTPADEHPNLSWMAQGDSSREFCAMITAVRSWAETQNGWDHPLKAIKDALLQKASGRVFQTDTHFADMAAQGGSTAEWDAFAARTRGDPLYFDYTVTS